MMHTGTGSRGHCRKAFGHSARVARALAMCGSVLLAAGCDRQPSPTTPGMPSSEQTLIRGLVSDTVRRPLAGALVAVLDGSLAGTTKLTDDAGKFELTGTAAGTVTLRVSRDGFHPITRALSWQQSNSTAIVEGFFRLETLEPAIGLDPGDYTLTIAIDLAASSNHRNLPQAPCAGFPVELASRSYQVTILPESSSLYDRVVRADDRPLHSETLFGSPSRDASSGSRWTTESPRISLVSAF